jgi:DNA repair photolyase
MYKYPLGLTQQFRFCGNPFRIDTYKGCDFGCLYCYANTRKGNYKNTFDIADFNVIESMFKKAFESDREYSNINIELLRHKVPLHLGGMSDPFQRREWKYGLTYKLLELSNKYKYPIIISTKIANLPQKYWDILNPEIHAFQISLMGYNENFVRKYEINTPTPQERIEFIKLLKSKGFWVGLRIQPLIDIDEAILLIKNVEQYNINYITIEHLKIPVDNKSTRKLFDDVFKKYNFYKPKQGRAYEIPRNIKIENINKIKSITNIPIGVGDNDLHELTDTRNCCGIDTINKNFNNWLKYNYTYFATAKGTENKKNIWYPQNNCRFVLNSADRGSKDFKTVKDYVDYYCETFQYSVFKSNQNNSQ